MSYFPNSLLTNTQNDIKKSCSLISIKLKFLKLISFKKPISQFDILLNITANLNF